MTGTRSAEPKDGSSPHPPAGDARRPSGPLLFVLLLAAVVMSIAVIVAVWMYWLGGVLPG